MNQRIVLKKHPTSNDLSDVFEVHSETLPDPALIPADNVLVRTLFLSIDGANRVWISPVKTYMKSILPGETMIGLVVVEIIESKSPLFQPGDVAVGGSLEWALYAVYRAELLKKIPKDYPKPEHFLGILGISGITAYCGLKLVAGFKPGETLLVSAAAGAVGELVVQMGKIWGLRVIGIAGSKDKCLLVESLGAEYCINYKEEDVLESLKTHCPTGVDIFFDNVGGKTLEDAIEVMNVDGRISLCGAISEYGNIGGQGVKFGVRNLERLIFNKIRMQGFLMGQYKEKFPEIIGEIIGLMKENGLKGREDITDGLENAPQALMNLLKGANNGKTLVRITGENAYKN